MDSSRNQIVISLSGAGPPDNVTDDSKVFADNSAFHAEQTKPMTSPESGSEMLVMNTCVCHPAAQVLLLSHMCGESCIVGIAGGFSTLVAVASQTRCPNPRHGKSCAIGCGAEALMTGGTSTPLGNAWQVLSSGSRQVWSGAEFSMSGGTNTPLADAWQTCGDSMP